MYGSGRSLIGGLYELPTHPGLKPVTISGIVGVATESTQRLSCSGSWGRSVWDVTQIRCFFRIFEKLFLKQLSKNNNKHARPNK